MEEPIRQEKIILAIRNLKNNKTPGPDGFSYEFYKNFSDELVPKLENVYNYTLQVKTIPKTCNEAKIVLVPKPDKDLCKIESCRPIALLNNVYKILRAIFAARLNKRFGA